MKTKDKIMLTYCILFVVLRYFLDIGNEVALLKTFELNIFWSFLLKCYLVSKPFSSILVFVLIYWYGWGSYSAKVREMTQPLLNGIYCFLMLAIAGLFLKGLLAGYSMFRTAEIPLINIIFCRPLHELFMILILFPKPLKAAATVNR